MPDEIATVMVRNENGAVRINAHEYDANKHGPLVDAKGAELPGQPLPAPATDTSTADATADAGKDGQKAATSGSAGNPAPLAPAAGAPSPLPPAGQSAQPAGFVTQQGTKWYVVDADGNKLIAKGFDSEDAARKAMQPA